MTDALGQCLCNQVPRPPPEFSASITNMEKWACERLPCGCWRAIVRRWHWPYYVDGFGRSADEAMEACEVELVASLMTDGWPSFNPVEAP